MAHLRCDALAGVRFGAGLARQLRHAARRPLQIRLRGREFGRASFGGGRRRVRCFCAGRQQDRQGEGGCLRYELHVGPRGMDGQSTRTSAPS